jgi:hypothetical protein
MQYVPPNAVGVPSHLLVLIVRMHPTFKKVHKDTEQDSPFVAQLVQKLKDQGYIIEDMAMGSLKYMGVCKLKSSNAIPRRLGSYH